MLAGFDVTPRTRLVFGVGTSSRLGELARELDARRALIVTDAGIVAAGHVERAQKALEAAGIAAAVFDATQENPTTEDVDACLQAARDAECDLFVGLGGGSSLDTAKGANFLLTNGGRMRDYWGVGKAQHPMLPMIAVPTTAGTGSECQSFALIADAETHQKMACGDPKAAPRIALLDPLLTLSQPRRVAAHTGMDALTHAVETFVTRRRNSYSLLYSREAFRLTVTHLHDALAHPGDLAARGGMLLGAAYAGIAIEASMLGAAHAAANPLTAHYGIVHGQAVGMMLPRVVQFNAEQPDIAAAYHDLAASAGLVERRALVSAGIANLLACLQQCLAAAGIPASLSAFGVTGDAIPALAQEAAAQWTAQHNPRGITAEDFERIYHAALA